MNILVSHALGILYGYLIAKIICNVWNKRISGCVYSISDAIKNYLLLMFPGVMLIMYWKYVGNIFNWTMILSSLSIAVELYVIYRIKDYLLISKDSNKETYFDVLVWIVMSAVVALSSIYILGVTLQSSNLNDIILEIELKLFFVILTIVCFIKAITIKKQLANNR